MTDGARGGEGRTIAPPKAAVGRRGEAFRARTDSQATGGGRDSAKSSLKDCSCQKQAAEVGKGLRSFAENREKSNSKRGGKDSRKGLLSLSLSLSLLWSVPFEGGRARSKKEDKEKADATASVAAATAAAVLDQ